MTYGGGPSGPDVRGGGAVQLVEHEQTDVGPVEDGLEVLERMPNVVVVEPVDVTSESMWRLSCQMEGVSPGPSVPQAVTAAEEPDAFEAEEEVM